jgi:hypothetical protein
MASDKSTSGNRRNFFLWRGFIYSKGAREPQSTTPEVRGDPPSPPNNRFHPNRCRSRLTLPEPTTESWSNRSSRAWRAGGRGVVAAAERPVTDEGGSGEGRG